MVKDVRTLEDFRIADFRWRVVICSMDDVVINSAEMRLIRKGIYEAWAYIAPKRASMFSKEGYAVKEKRDSPSHNIAIRYRADISFSTAAWIYEKRLKSPPRWFKILGYQNKDEGSEYYIFSARLVEQSDLAVEPAEGEEPKITGAYPLPDGVKL